MRRGGSSSFYHFDDIGNTSALTDRDGNVTDTYRHNAFGEEIERTGTTPNPHTYVGRERYYAVPEVMLYLLGLRYYNNVLGRFLNADPAKIWPNLYAYADGRPTLMTDPLGLKCCLNLAAPVAQPSAQ